MVATCLPLTHDDKWWKNMKDVRLEISSCSGCPFESGQTFFAKRPEGSVASSFQRTSCCHSTYRFQTRINQFKSYPDSVLFRKPLAGTIENVICGFTPMVSCLNQKNVTSCLIKSFSWRVLSQVPNQDYWIWGEFHPREAPAGNWSHFGARAPFLHL